MSVQTWLIQVVLDFGPVLNSHKDCHVISAPPVFGMKIADSHKNSGGELDFISAGLESIGKRICCCNPRPICCADADV